LTKNKIKSDMMIHGTHQHAGIGYNLTSEFREERKKRTYTKIIWNLQWILILGFSMVSFLIQRNLQLTLIPRFIKP
jgi:hypothetical protein